MTVRIERLEASHFAAIAALHRRVFRSRLTADEVRAKYAAGHTGLSNIGFVALEGERAVTFHGAVPQEFEVDGRRLLVGQSCDSMADPAFHGRGLYGEVFLRSEALLVESGAALMYGFANQSSARALGRLGWKSVSLPLHRTSFEVATLPLARLLWHTGPGRPLLAAAARRAFGRPLVPLEGLRNGLLDEGYLAHRTTPEALRYQARLPSFAVRLGTARAWIKVSPDLMIGDLEATDVDALRTALTQLQARCRWLGVRQIHAFTCPGVRLDGMLAALRAPQPGLVLMTGTTAGTELALRLRVRYADADTF